MFCSEMSLDGGPTSTVLPAAEGGGLLGPRQLDAAQTPPSAADKPCKVAQLHSWMIDPESAPEGCSLLFFLLRLQLWASTWESISTTRSQTGQDDGIPPNSG
jgi:hypothetical protein